MLSNILYFKHFDKKNANLVIVISKLTELNTISLPFGTSKILKNKNIVTNLYEKKYAESYIESHELQIYFDVKIFLIEKNNISSILAGSKFYTKFDNMFKQNISFIFSSAPPNPLSSFLTEFFSPESISPNITIVLLVILSFEPAIIYKIYCR